MLYNVKDIYIFKCKFFIQTYYQWFEFDANQNENNFNSVIKSENLTKENLSNPNPSIKL